MLKNISKVWRLNFLSLKKKYQLSDFKKNFLLKVADNRHSLRLGYELLTYFQKKKSISKAAHFILNYASKDLNLTKIEVFEDCKNLNSLKLIQKFN